MSGEYENTKRISYEGGDGFGDAIFVPVCEKCGRFVKPNESISVSEMNGLKDEPNAVCSKCGNTKMLFEGFF